MDIKEAEAFGHRINVYSIGKRKEVGLIRMETGEILYTKREIYKEFEELYKGNNERFAPRFNPVFSKAWSIQVLPDDFKRSIKKKIKRSRSIQHE